jgi:hypothetical protein
MVKRYATKRRRTRKRHTTKRHGTKRRNTRPRKSFRRKLIRGGLKIEKLEQITPGEYDIIRPELSFENPDGRRELDNNTKDKLIRMITGELPYYIVATGSECDEDGNVCERAVKIIEHGNVKLLNFIFKYTKYTTYQKHNTDSLNQVKKCFYDDTCDVYYGTRDSDWRNVENYPNA